MINNHNLCEQEIKALRAEAEQYKSDWKACTAMNRELLAEVERLKQEQAEPVKFLANGTRFKTSEYPYGVCINGLPKELSGRWVALVAAEDDCHLKLTAPQGQTELLKQALKALEYLDVTSEYKVDGRIADAAITAIKQHLGEA